MTGMQKFDPSSATTTARDPWVGSVVGGRYRVDAWIGQGGMGVVYRGEHLELGKRVAIKRLDQRIASDPDWFERFRREAIAASQIDSPHVVHVFDWGKAADGSPYLVMELLDGCDLRQLFQREGRLLLESATAIVGQILRALIRTHHAQIIHRDLKPENVFLCRYDSDEPHVKLLDFGISKRTTEQHHDGTVTRRGVILGTASYMSPEQARGEVELDARSDLYSVGTILFEALTGRVPHAARTYEGTLVDICTRDAEDVRLHAPLVPEAVAVVVAQALQRDVTLRFQTAKAFLDALTAAVPELAARLPEHPPAPTSSLSADVTAIQKSTPSRRGPLWFSVAALTIAGIAVLGWMTKLASSVHKTEPSSIVARHAGGSKPATLATTILDTPPAIPNSIVVAAPSVATVSYKHLNGAPAATASGRATAPHSTGAAAAPTIGPSNTSGVAPGLKLRRTMP